VQATGAHRLDLGGVGLDREELHRLARHHGHVVEEGLPHFGVDRRVLDGRVGEDQNRRIDPLALIGGEIRDQIAIGVREPRIELEGGGGQRKNGRDGHGGEKTKGHWVLRLNLLGRGTVGKLCNGWMTAREGAQTHLPRGWTATSNSPKR
jgi:hypothetical protein